MRSRNLAAAVLFTSIFITNAGKPPALAAQVGPQRQGDDDPNSCAVLSAPQIRVDLLDLMSSRLPQSPGAGSSGRCHQVLDDRIAQWKKEDESNAKQLRNRFCSASLGWVENAPNICGAGGPPPICPRTDHWHKDLFSAGAQLQKFREENQKKKESRASELSKLKCQCGVDDARSADARAAASQSALVGPLPPPTGISIRCSSAAECKTLPGFECIQGYCRRQGESGLDFDEAIKHLIEHQDFGPSRVFSTSWVQIVLGVINPAPLGTSSVSYSQHVDAMFALLGQVPNNIKALQTASVNSPTHTNAGLQLDDIRVRILELTRHLNDDKAGVVRDEEFGTDACYDMLSYQHEKIVDQATKVASYIQTVNK